MSSPEPLIASADVETGREHEYTVAFRGDIDAGYWSADDPFMNHTGYRDGAGAWHLLTARNYGSAPREQSRPVGDGEIVVLAKREYPLGRIPPR